jgi:hypothetical protein
MEAARHPLGGGALQESALLKRLWRRVRAYLT